jgi:hypothetical protein
MVDWQDLIDSIRFGVMGGAMGALIGGVIFTAGAILYAPFRQPRARRSLWTTLRPLRWVGPVAFVLGFTPCVFLSWLLADACGASHVNQFPSPDGQHRIVVYAFDCGATTDFSLMVSLFNRQEQFPEHRARHVLYSRYHDLPSPDEFQVIWRDTHHAVVRLTGYDGKPSVTEDGVTVRFKEKR